MDKSQVASKVCRLLAIGGAILGSFKSGRPKQYTNFLFF
jgi:hypothetical protein